MDSLHPLYSSIDMTENVHYLGRAVNGIFRKIASGRWTVGYFSLVKNVIFLQKWTNWSQEIFLECLLSKNDTVA